MKSKSANQLINTAVIQMNSSRDVAANLADAKSLLAEAAGRGAKVALLPENFACLSDNEHDKLAVAETLGNGPIQQFLSEQAEQLSMAIIAGTIPISSSDDKKVFASSLVYNDQGRQIASYHKIHLFDVRVNDAESYQESATVTPGDQIVVADLFDINFGLSVCYDLRFPELYRQLAIRGAKVLTVPSAFTYTTGSVHWHTLLRARAIENSCYVIAANQAGFHGSQRRSYGHSMIINPWGEILAELDEATPGVIVQAIDIPKLEQLRQHFPSFAHRRL